jgi:hypothetical protein
MVVDAIDPLSQAALLLGFLGTFTRFMQPELL